MILPESPVLPSGLYRLKNIPFFVVQPIFTCLWLHFIAVRIQMLKNAFLINPKFRWIPVGTIVILWLVSFSWLIGEWTPGTYMGVILVWALPPIGLLFFYGGDILNHHWWLVAISFLLPTIYLSLADSLAIYQGIWEIATDQSMEIFLGRVLSIEDFTFFLVTNFFICFGVTLLLSNLSHDRMLFLFKYRSSFPPAVWRKVNRG